MNSAEFQLSSCRICLRDGATYPIFDETTSETSIHFQLNKCFTEKIEDLVGYPRHICASCKITLDMLCEFIDRYKESCELLRKSVFKVKTEVDIRDVDDEPNFIDSDDFVWYNKEYLEIKVENNQNISNASELLEKLKVPGLIVTKVKSEKCINEAEKDTTVNKNRSSKRKCVEPINTQLKTSTNIKETTHKRVKKLIETKEKEEKSKEKLALLCDICGAVFSLNYQLNSHIEARHSNTKYTCSICLKQFNYEYRLKVHTTTVHSNKKFICDLCKKEYKTRSILRQHILWFHEKKKKLRNYTCKYCEKVYKCSQSLIIHERSEHSGLRPAVCHVCGKAFFHDIYLREHVRLHTGELPFRCPICDRGYTQHGNMKSHLRQHKVSELNETIMPKMRPCYMKRLKNC